MPYHSLRFLWLSITALIAGAINSVAGGGSLLTFPALLQAGVLPKQANGMECVMNKYVSRNSRCNCCNSVMICAATLTSSAEVGFLARVQGC